VAAWLKTIDDESPLLRKGNSPMNVTDIPVLSTALRTGQVQDAAGASYPFTSGINPFFAQALHDLVLREKPGLVIEIGMANGVSTLAILSALAHVGRGRLISIDPTQSTYWHGVGTANVKRAGFAGQHQLIEAPDHVALPQLLAASTRANLAYIDGTHTFDHVLLDAFYLDKMLPVGGVMGFNDTSYKAIHRVIRFMQTHREYDELDVGLARDYSGKGGLIGMALRMAQGRSAADRWFRKSREADIAWDFYREF
jgi:hypothetical protein